MGCMWLPPWLWKGEGASEAPPSLIQADLARPTCSADVNIDEALIADKVRFAGGEQLVALSNGCICCSIREDLVREVRKLAAQGTFDCLIIESTGISLPLPVAATFGHVDERGESLSDEARLDSLVTVVDAERFVSSVMMAESLKDKGMEVDENDDRTVADLLIEQVRAMGRGPWREGVGTLPHTHFPSSAPPPSAPFILPPCSLRFPRFHPPPIYPPRCLVQPTISHRAPFTLRWSLPTFLC